MFQRFVAAMKPSGFRRVLAAFAVTAALSPAAEAETVAGVARVRDGDTIVVAGVPVRLRGLHCPEPGEPGGQAASAAMRKLVRGAQVTCELTGARSHDRKEGRCAVNGRDLAALLIGEGVCARCERFDFDGRYASAQRKAGAWERPIPEYCE